MLGSRKYSHLPNLKTSSDKLENLLQDLKEKSKMRRNIKNSCNSPIEPFTSENDT